MVGLDRVDHALVLAVSLRELGRDDRVRALDLVRHRLADVVQQRGPLGGLHARPELARHDSGQVHDLERVLEDVLSVARAVAQLADDLHELLVELATAGLENRLLPGLADVVLELGLREVVHLLDPRRVDPPVLDQLLERRPRHLAPEPVEGREDDRLRCVVDDEVDTGQMLERPDVASLAPDDPSLHVIGRQLDHGDRRLRGVARSDTLERVRDQRPRSPPRLRPRLLLLLPNAAGELVPDQVLRALEQVVLRLRDGEPRDLLELRERFVLRRLQLVLELLDVRLPVGEALVAAFDLRRPAGQLVLGGRDPFLGACSFAAPLLHLILDLTSKLDRHLARLDLRLAANRLGFALGDMDARTAANDQQRRSEAGTESESDERRKRREHGVLPPWGEGRFDRAGLRKAGLGAHIRRSACAAVLRSRARRISLEPAVPPRRRVAAGSEWT